jgi:DNA-binding transcriptional MerR regulator
MPYREKDIEKKYFSIGEVAERFKVAPSLIRFWETEFEILSPKKNKKGNRQYTKEDLDNLTVIFHLVKEKGYTLQGAKEALKNSFKKPVDKVEVIKSLEKVKDFLLELKKSLP